MRPQLLGKLRQNGDIATLAALRFRDQNNLLVKEHILRFDVYKLRDPCTSLEQSLDEQSSFPFHPVGVTDCNRNGSGLQSAAIADHIICIYPSPRTGFRATETAIHRLGLQSTVLGPH